MIYRFEDFQLDTARAELSAHGALVALEPQVFALLCLLIEHRDRLVTKDEIVAQIWGGRIISNSAIASRVKSLRRALGDDGAAQRVVRTIHGMGFRFIAEVTKNEAAAVAAAETTLAAPAPERARPSIAVLPFQLVGIAGPQSAIAEALPADLITELSRLRWLFVIARASSFRFRGGEANLDRVRTELNVRYCLSGAVELVGEQMIVSVELSDAHDRGVIWGDRFRAAIGAVHEVREEIVRAVINALELHIPLNEARRARLKSPENLDAWAAYHLGLQHMYRFNRADNALATEMFARAATLEPGFARAYAGLSFTHFQDAFLGYADDVSAAAQRARRYAEQSLERDPVDPFGNLTMGRTFLLGEDIEASLSWLDRANALNPNYAQAKYSRAWTESLLGRSAQSQADVDAALALSPLDPLRYAMLAVRAFTHIVQDEPAAAAEWADRGARAPGAHALIEMIAALAHGLNDDDSRARSWAASARARAPDLDRAEFFRVFPFREPHTRKRIAAALKTYGF